MPIHESAPADSPSCQPARFFCQPVRGAGCRGGAGPAGRHCIMIRTTRLAMSLPENTSSPTFIR